MAGSVLKWVSDNQQIFSGVLAAIVTGVFAIFLWSRKSKTARQTVPSNSQDQNAGLSLATGASVGAFVVGSNNTLNVGPQAAADLDETTRDSAVELILSMPALMREMRTDLLNPDYVFVREFCVLPSGYVNFGFNSKKMFHYYEAAHPGLRNQLDLFEEQGLVKDVTPVGSKLPIYRMTEKLVRQLRAELS